MSTWYFLACAECRTKQGFYAVKMSGEGVLFSNLEPALRTFMDAHAAHFHQLLVVSEQTEFASGFEHQR